MQLLIGFTLAALIGIIARRYGLLSNSGFWGAFLTGGLIFGFGGIPWAVVLLTFFISSSAISRLFASEKKQITTRYAKGSRRDLGQVLANGGLGILLVITHAILPERIELWYAYIGGMAAVNADTWATELGVLNRTPPRLITNGKPVERGTSGGVSQIGYLAVSFGGLLVGSIAAVLTPNSSPLTITLGAVLAGLAGSTLDSLLGATIQAQYYCSECEKETERHPLHVCGTQTVPVRGWHWLNNDWVNFACSLAGALSSLSFNSLIG